MRMAMGLQGTFDALVPYFVYRTVLEQAVVIEYVIINVQVSLAFVPNLPAP